MSWTIGAANVNDSWPHGLKDTIIIQCNQVNITVWFPKENQMWCKSSKLLQINNETHILINVNFLDMYYQF